MAHQVPKLQTMLLVVATVPVIARAQTPSLTVAEARRQAARLGAAEVSVHGHFWCGKEGSMIYDSYYKAILKIRYSDAYSKEHTSFRSVCGFDIEHKSNLVTMTGHIEGLQDGKFALVVNKFAFDK